MLHEAVGRRILIGLALCILGGFALLGESYGFAPQRLLGDLYGVATAVGFGCYVLAVRAARARHGAAELMFASTAITAACLLSSRLRSSRASCRNRRKVSSRWSLWRSFRRPAGRA